MTLIPRFSPRTPALPGFAVYGVAYMRDPAGFTASDALLRLHRDEFERVQMRTIEPNTDRIDWGQSSNLNAFKSRSTRSQINVAGSLLQLHLNAFKCPTWRGGSQ